MIVFENVSKAYRSGRFRKVILNNFSCEFPRGRNIGLLGVNGAGKSTVLRMIAGTEYADSGKIKRFVRVSFPLGFSGSFKGNLTARENCRFVARIYGLDTRAVERFVEEFAEIGKSFDQPISTYSSGMRARVSFGLSMAIDFECYLVDEILGVGDATFRERCAEVFRAKRQTASMILVSHQMSTLRQHCDMGGIISKGRIRLYDKLDDAINEYLGMTNTTPSLEPVE